MAESVAAPKAEKGKSAPVTACPECGTDLTSRDRRGHAIRHYGERPVDAGRFPDAAKRQRLILGEESE